MNNYLKQLKIIYSINKKRTYLTILFFHISNSIFELFNIALLLPLVAILSKNTNQFEVYEKFLPEFFKSLSYSEKIIICFFSIFFIYLLKILFFIFGHWYQSTKVYKCGANIADVLLKKYISAPFIFLQNKSSSYLIRNIYKEVNELIESNIRPIFYILNDALVLTFILIFLLIIDYKKFLILLIIATIFFLFFYFIRSLFLRYGKKRQYFDETRLEHLQNLFNSIKEIKIYNRQEFFFNKFSEDNQKNYKYAGKNLFLSNMPRILIEILAILIILFFIIFFVKNNTNILTDDLETKVLFFAATIRFIPLVSRINISINALRYGYATTNLISTELVRSWDWYENENKKQNETCDFNQSVKFENLNFSYSGKEKKILSNFNFEIKKGNIVKIIGDSGSGKTTLINLLLAFLEPVSGKIKIDNIDIKNIKNSWRKKIGFVSQQIFLFNNTLRENIIFGSDYNEKKFDEVIKFTNLQKILDNKKNFNFDSLINERGKNLSGGEIQRIGIARALYNGAEVLILDEPTSSLDEENAKIIEELVYKLRGDKTIIIVSHSQNLFLKSDQILNLNSYNIK